MLSARKAKEITVNSLSESEKIQDIFKYIEASAKLYEYNCEYTLKEDDEMSDNEVRYLEELGYHITYNQYAKTLFIKWS